jgi:hypothetical protein
MKITNKSNIEKKMQKDLDTSGKKGGRKWDENKSR